MNFVLLLLRLLFGPAWFGDSPTRPLAIRPDGRLQSVSFRDRLRYTRLPNEQRNGLRNKTRWSMCRDRLLRMVKRILNAAGALWRGRAGLDL
ncbi:MAG: hypothetical protein R3C99_13730 [Pirellulaceae bacterium]|nr:hypothetical protein [Planctomycetales bacterium]MCA9228856.1 hypothetical protein [Planctomycetales bacterium]